MSSYTVIEADERGEEVLVELVGRYISKKDSLVTHKQKGREEDDLSTGEDVSSVEVSAQTDAHGVGKSCDD